MADSVDTNAIHKLYVQFAEKMQSHVTLFNLVCRRCAANLKIHATSALHIYLARGTVTSYVCSNGVHAE
jgi:hypothetical protein